MERRRRGEMRRYVVAGRRERVRERVNKRDRADQPNVDNVSDVQQLCDGSGDYIS